MRLLLTAKDIASVAGEKVAFRRVPLPGIPTTDDQDALYFEPEKGANFGFAIEVFRGRDQEAVRERYAAMLASYPSATEIAPVAGKTFFAYWDEAVDRGDGRHGAWRREGGAFRIDVGASSRDIRLTTDIELPDDAALPALIPDAALLEDAGSRFVQGHAG